MLIYFDSNGVVKEIITDYPVRQGSTNEIFCYFEDEPSFDDLMIVLRLPDGTLTTQVSIIENTTTKTIAYNKYADYKYFVQGKTYSGYYYTLTQSDLLYDGLGYATITGYIDSEVNTQGLVTFNIEESILKTDNLITQSQYEYLLTLIASRTLNEQTANDLYETIEQLVTNNLTSAKEELQEDYDTFTETTTETITTRLDAQDETIAGLGQLQPNGVDTSTNILAKTTADGIWIGTDTGEWYYWDANNSSYVSGGVYQATQIANDSVHKYNLNDDVYEEDVISINGVTFISPNNTISMLIYFQATGSLTINVKGNRTIGGSITRLKIGYNSTNTGTSPTLTSNETITGEFDKTYTISHNNTFTCIIFEVAVGSFATFDDVLEIASPEIKINNVLMTKYSNIVFQNYTPTNYKYLVTGKPNITSDEYVENYVNDFYDENIVPKLVNHNIINVSTAQSLVNAINSIATTTSNNIANKNDVYDIYLASGIYELYDVIDKTNLQDQTLFRRGLEIPDYVNLYGVGDVTIKLTLPSTESATNVQILSTLNIYGENYFENLNIEITNGRYCVHDDSDGNYKNRIVSFKNCNFKHNGNSIGAWTSQECYGAGYRGGKKGIFINCKLESVNFEPLYMHTNSAYFMTDKCYLELNNCVLSGNYTYCLDIHDPYGATNTAIIDINNCYLGSKLRIRGTQPFTFYGGGNNDFDIYNNTTTPSNIYIVGNSNSNFD